MKSYPGKPHCAAFAACAMSLFATNADAFIDMPDRERVQAIAWTIEGVGVAVIMLVFWFVWRIGKRAQSNKKPKQEGRTDE